MNIIYIFTAQELIGNDIFAIKKREYLGEVRMQKGENIAVLPCEIFHRKLETRVEEEEETNGIDIDTEANVKHDYWRYCFDYVTTNMKGSTNTTTSFCMPAKLKGNFFYSVFSFLIFFFQYKYVNYPREIFSHILLLNHMLSER